MAAFNDERQGLDIDAAVVNSRKTFEKEVSVQKMPNFENEDGIFAARRLQKGETIWKEQPFLVAIDPNSQLASLACDHCGRFLGPVEKQLEYMLREDQGVRYCPPQFSDSGLPPLEALQTDCIPCSLGCHTLYCSDTCRESAWREYHCLLCPRGRTDNHPESAEVPPLPAEIFFNQAVCINDNFMLVAKIAASLIIRQESAEAYLRHFCHGLWWDVFSPPDDDDHCDDEECQDSSSEDLQDVGDDDESTGGSAANELRLQESCYESYYLFELMVTKNLLPAQQVTVSLEDYARIGALVERNSAECKVTSPLASYFEEHAAELDANKSPLMQAVRANLPYKDEDFEWPPLRTGIFSTLTSKLNHSCTPNSELVRSAPNALSVLQALTDIEPGSEVFISYIDADIPDAKTRREHLSKPYLFHCDCVRCSSE